MRRKRIPVVENHDQVRRMIIQALSKIPEYEVTAASNNRDALDLAARDNPDLIITDLGPPDPDDIDFIRSLRLDPSTQRIPITFMTAGQRGTETSAFTGCIVV